MKKNLRCKSNLKRKKRHGFRQKSRTRWGREVLRKRRREGRKKLTV